MEEYLTPQEIAELLKVSYQNALAFIKDSGLPHFKVGRQYRVNRAALEDHLHKLERIE